MAALTVIQIFKDDLALRESVLFERAREIDIKNYPQISLKKIVHDMFETLYSNPTGVGLAANQVGLLIRICVIDTKRDGKNPIVLINPEYQGIGELTESKEVCLSFPDAIVTTQRYKKIKVRYQNVMGEEIEETIEGFKSTVFQHEIDHLNGICHVSTEHCSCVDDYHGRPNLIATEIVNKLWGES